MSKCCGVVVERVHDDVNPLLNSVEFIWGTTTVAVGDTAVLHCSFDAIFQQLRTGSVSFFISVIKGPFHRLSMVDCNS